LGDLEFRAAEERLALDVFLRVTRSRRQAAPLGAFDPRLSTSTPARCRQHRNIVWEARVGVFFDPSRRIALT
jgi:hypothetical protein